MAATAPHSVLVIDADAEVRERIAQMLAPESDLRVVGQSADGLSGLAAAADLLPAAILLDVQLPDIDVTASVEALIRRHPLIPVIVLGYQQDTDALRRAMLAGATAFLLKPFTAQELTASLRQTLRLHASAMPELAGLPVRPSRGRIIAVFSPKGGVGSSSVAANLAIALRRVSGQRVALVDANLMFGDQHLLLDMHAEQTFLDLVHDPARLASLNLTERLTSHSTQIQLLPALPDAQQGEQISPVQMTRVLEALQRDFAYVIVDTPSTLQDRTFAVLDSADRIVTLMSLEIPCVRNVKLFLDWTTMLGYPPEKTMLVVNRLQPAAGLSLEDVETMLARPVRLTIADAGVEMATAMNLGVPLIMSRPELPTSRDIVALADELDAGGSALPQLELPSPPRRGLLARFLRGRR
jgi:pilus assembly protein CpaE